MYAHGTADVEGDAGGTGVLAHGSSSLLELTECTSSGE